MENNNFIIEHKCEAAKSSDGKGVRCQLCNKFWSNKRISEGHVPCKGWHLLEKIAERKFVAYVREDGNRSIKYEKRKGDPDQLVLIAPFYFFFIEFKRKGEQLEPLQIERHKDLLGAGYAVYTTSSLKEAKEIYKSEKSKAAQLSKKGS